MANRVVFIQSLLFLRMDLRLQDGDIVFENNDVVLTSNTRGRDVKRAIVTPLKYIGRDSVEGRVDDNYGNGLYYLLSEPLTRTWITEARKQIDNAIAYAEVEGQIIDVNVSVDSDNKISIPIVYHTNEETLDIRIDL